MRAILLTTVALFCLSVECIAQLKKAPAPSGIAVGYRIEEYFYEVYTPAPQQEYAFFQGEPITFRLIVANLGPAEATLVAESREPQRLFQIQAFRAPLADSDKPAERARSVDGRQFLDEGRVSIPVTFSSPIKAWSGGEFDVQLERDTPLNIGESLQWVMHVPSANLEPGYYRVEVRVSGTHQGQPLREFANVRFEVRPRNVDAQPELLRREALRRLLKEDFAGAREAANELLAVHAGSAVAHDLLARTSDAEGRKDEAEKHRATADTLRKNGRDELLLKFPHRRVPD